jgi:hypothetical protein
MLNVRMEFPIHVMVIGLLLLFGCGGGADRAPDPGPPALAPPAVELAARPSWFPIGGDISQPGDLDEAQARVLSLGQQPHWFLAMPRKVSSSEYAAYWSRMNGGYVTTRPTGDDLYIPAALPYPQDVQALPLRDDGVSLELEASTTPDAAVLVLTLRLSSPQQPLVREVQLGQTNVLPFLFAICVDGKTVAVTATGDDISGGGFGDERPFMIPLVAKGSTKTWQIHLDANSLAARLPDAHAHAVTLTAVFSNFQHEVYFGDSEPSLASLIIPSGARQDSQIVVRSNSVTLQWTGAVWHADHADHAD